MQHKDDSSVSRPTPPAIRHASELVAGDLSRWRKLRSLTQAQLADRSGVSRDTVTRLEGGDGGVSLENVLKVLRALGILDVLTAALDPYESDVGRLRSDRELPHRVRPARLTKQDHG